MRRTRKHEVQGFGPPITSPRQWLGPGPCLDLPSAFGERGGSTLPPVAGLLEGGRPPVQVCVEGWVEAFGALEPRLGELARIVPEGGVLVMNTENQMAPSLVRRCFEGRLGTLDRRPSLGDRELSFPTMRLARALSDAGWVLEDLAPVQFWDRKLPQLTVEVLLKAGYAPTRYLYEIPGERIWIRARRSLPLAGSVLVAQRPGREEAASRTRQSLEPYLPRGWELVLGPAEEREVESWNRAVPTSRGDLLWLLRAGDEPDRATFKKLSFSVLRHPVIPADPDGEARQGLAGAMIQRAALLDTGPLPRELDSDLVAGEEWIMRASAANHTFEEVRMERPWKGPGLEADPCAEKEAKALIERWRKVHDLENPGHNEARPVPTPPWILEERKPRISLCMIARNEEENLGACLERVKGIVDEIILVDTGSSDRTVEIAESFGAKILHRDWDGDFSAPRNLSLEEASGDWILVLDADELVEEGSVPDILELARNERASGYHFRFVNQHEEGRTHGITMVRLFRNLPGLEYRYAIHEQVVPSLMAAADPLNLGLHPSEVTVVHFGYSDECMEERGKYERNLALFEKQLEEDPGDVYCLYKYGDFIRQMKGPSEKVIEIFERALEEIYGQAPSAYREMPFAGEVAALLALEYAKNGRVEEAFRTVRRGLMSFIPTPNLHYLCASLATSMGRFEEGLDQFRGCLSYEGKTLVVPIQEGTTGWVTFTGMAQCWIGKGDFDRAEELLLKAIEDKPDWEVSHLRLSSLILQRGRTDEALSILNRFLEKNGENGPVRFQGGLLLEHSGIWDGAGTWYEKALEAGEVDETLVRRQAGAMKLAGKDLEGARRHWKALGTDPVSHACLAILDWIEAGTTPSDLPFEGETRRVVVNLKEILERAGLSPWSEKVGELLVNESMEAFSGA